jgi:hypothetical protein
MGYDLENVDMNQLGDNVSDQSTSENQVSTGVLGADDGKIEPGTSDTSTDAEKQYYKYTANGREVNEDIDTILKRASQGYNYAQNIQQLKADRETFDKTISEREAQIREAESRWSQYDQYANENPEWADHVRSQYENRYNFNGQQPGSQIDQNQTDPNLSPQLRQEISELRQFRDEFKSYQANQKQQSEDIELNNQIESTKKSYTDFDFGYSDPNTGETVEHQVLRHMQSHGLNNFRAAFRDLFHDQIVTKASTKAKETAMKEIQERNKKGFISESDKSQFSNQSGRNGSSFRNYHEGIEAFINENNLG